jgi:hypothetical protein
MGYGRISGDRPNGASFQPRPPARPDHRHLQPIAWGTDAATRFTSGVQCAKTITSRLHIPPRKTLTS